MFVTVDGHLVVCQSILRGDVMIHIPSLVLSALYRFILGLVL